MNSDSLSPHFCCGDARCLLCLAAIEAGQKCRAVIAKLPQISPAIVFPPDCVPRKLAISGREICLKKVCSQRQSRATIYRPVFLMHETCFMMLWAICKRRNRRVTGDEIALLALSCQSILPSTIQRNHERERTILKSWFWSQGTRLEINRAVDLGFFTSLFSLPAELQHIIATFSGPSLAQATITCLVHANSYVNGSLAFSQFADLTKRSVQLTGHVYVQRIDIGGVGYVSRISNDQFPNAECMEIPVGVDALLSWDDIGLLALTCTTPEEPAARVGGNIWYQKLPKGKDKSFMPYKTGVLIKSLRSMGATRSLVWDIPSPPDIPVVEEARILSLSSEEVVPMRYVGIGRDCCGLTVTNSVMGTVSLRSHTSLEPCDPSLYELLDPSTDELVRVFHPLQPGEAISQLWIRELDNPTTNTKPTVVLCTDRGSKCTFGPHVELEYRHAYRMRTLTAGVETSVSGIFYNDLGTASHESELRIQTTHEKTKQSGRHLNFPWPSTRSEIPSGLSYNGWYLSEATLEAVSMTELFSVQCGTGLRVGVLIHYTSGSIAALGECRIGEVFPIKAVSPGGVEWTNDSDGYVQNVGFYPRKLDRASSPSAKVLPMGGRLTWWFCTKGSKIEYVCGGKA